MKYKYLLNLLFFCCSALLAQPVNHFECGVGHDNSLTATNFGPLSTPNYSGSTDPAYLSGNFSPISFDLFFWIIRKDDGSADFNVTYEHLLQNIKRTNEHFKPMGICFILKGYGYIDKSSIYENATLGTVSSYADNNNHVKQNCFNVYLPKKLAQGNGVTNNGNNKLLVGQEATLGMWEFIMGNTLAHELGHTFSLIHVWGGDNFGAETQEHVTRNPSDPNYNALTTADLVHDTPAMISFYREAILNGVSLGDIMDLNNCSYLGDNTDNLGVPFQLNPNDVGNLMGYAWDPCKAGFTTGQGIRMREYIRDSPNANSVKAKRPNPVALDLYIKDSPDDFGAEPNLVTEHLWDSRDIWIRKNNDGLPDPQNPEYRTNGQPNYVYVRVTNKGCDTSLGTEQLKLYWSKAATTLSWPAGWNGSTYPNGGPVRGNILGTQNIPVLKPGEEAILAFPWVIPNPNNYTGLNPEPWHFCLLARIDVATDAMAITETMHLNDNVKNNNNIAWRNVTVVDLEPNLSVPTGGVVAVGNYFTTTKPYNLAFKTDSRETGSKIFTEAEVIITLSTTLLNAWNTGGRVLQNMVQTGTNKFKVTGENAMLKNLVLAPQATGTLNLTFNFLTQQLTPKERFTYHIVQTDAGTNAIIGGETYNIKKYNSRTAFYASAGDDMQANRNEEVTLSAAPVNEPVLYNWYNSSGDLIYEGADLTVTAQIAETYKLEVIALNDGYKDYTEVAVGMKPNTLNAISPNPASDTVIIDYTINTGTSAYVSINGFYNTTASSNYILDINAGQAAINVSNYPNGFYTIQLICDGQVTDTKTLIKQ